jgi:isoleucyl-tRNA synthetase
MSPESMAKAVEEYKQGSVNVEGLGALNSDIFTLNNKPKADFVIANSNGVSIVLDITIDENLMKEGLSRELIRTIQVLRKEANFNIEQRISMFIETEDETLKSVVETYKDKIISEALVKSYEDMPNPTVNKVVEIGGEQVTIKLKD